MTDDDRLAEPLAAARALPRGSMVVVRARDAKGLSEFSRAMLKLARRKGLAVLIAGDPELATHLGADGVHLSEVRMDEAAYWRVRYPAQTITASAHSSRSLLRAQHLPVDAVFLSPILATRSHPDRAALTSLRANMIARESKIPVYALGGIDARNARLLAPDAFAGIAAVGALAV
jgi:thiamine-phosphate pyrophosphorylase